MGKIIMITSNSIDGLPAILKQGESQTVEFKENFQEEALQTVGAFANTHGGTLLIGVNDAGIPTGVTVGKATLREMADKIAACTEPRVVPDLQVATLQRRTIIVIQVPEYPIKPVAVRGRCYRRVGDSNRQLSPSAIAEMHMASTGTSWDARPLTDRAIKDLDLARVRRYMMLATNVGRRNFVRGDRPRDVLEKLELVRDGHPTWAAVLLFGKLPQSPLTQATVHCGRFRTEIDIDDDRMIEGSIIDQIDETMDFIKKHINVRFVITGKPQRDQIWDYPLEALREAVVNAICHRDYSATADIQIKVFDDHVRIWSPGLLPYGVTLEDLYRRTHASKPRNKLIAQVFYDLEIIERYGSGIQRILDACAAAGLPEPTFGESTGGLVVIFRKAAKTTGRQQLKQPESQPESSTRAVPVQYQSLEERVLALLRQEPLPASIISRQLGQKRVSGQLKIVLNKLLSDTFVEFTIPDKPNSRLQKYRLTAKGQAILQRKK
jgi:ATP-dependent DNA helicase RecG